MSPNRVSKEGLDTGFINMHLKSLVHSIMVVKLNTGSLRRSLFSDEDKESHFLLSGLKIAEEKNVKIFLLINAIALTSTQEVKIYLTHAREIEGSNEILQTRRLQTKLEIPF